MESWKVCVKFNITISQTVGFRMVLAVIHLWLKLNLQLYPTTSNHDHHL